MAHKILGEWLRFIPDEDVCPDTAVQPRLNYAGDTP